MFNIGPYQVNNRVILAPMAGITDLPFRQLCRQMGAGLTVAEMVTSDTSLWHTRKSQQRLIHRDEPEPRAVQIAGADPEMMAEAARANVELGAQVIDINMGCPAKKVCKKAAGSALLKDEQLVEDILSNVVNAVDVPVTLKIRTGWSPENRNGEAIARIAEQSGIAALAVHGRTRACRFMGNAEYDTIARIVDSVSIPVFANGDIDSPQKARSVLDYTSAAAVMIGRSAQGRPWLFREINHYLATGELLPEPDITEICELMTNHVSALADHYGDFLGPRIARKHVGWYLQTLSHQLADARAEQKQFNALEHSWQQQEFLTQLFNKIGRQQEEVA